MNYCIVCGNKKSIPLYKGIVKCTDCSHVFCDTHLDEEKIFKLYDKNYFFGDEYPDYLSDESVVKKNFILRLAVLRKFIDPSRRRYLLEIGCAYGFFLSLAENFFDTVIGIDVSADSIHYARENLKLNAIKDNLLSHDFSNQKFDAVCMWDTIEHLSNPQLYLEKISSHTEKGALLALTTGDIESLNARLKKDRWRLMHPPTHLHYFSKRTLAALLNKYGFDIIYNRYCGFYRSVDMVAYRAFVLTKKFPMLYKLLRKCRLTGLNFYLNLYDIMYIIARKR